MVATPKEGAGGRAELFGGKPGNRGIGRPRGTPNKITGQLKALIFKAMEMVGDEQSGEDEPGGALRFLMTQAAKENNAPFIALVNKIIPQEIKAEIEVTTIEDLVVRARQLDRAAITPALEN
jgi:hypothetical protein